MTTDTAEAGLSRLSSLTTVPVTGTVEVTAEDGTKKDAAPAVTEGVQNAVAIAANTPEGNASVAVANTTSTITDAMRTPVDIAGVGATDKTSITPEMAATINALVEKGVVAEFNKRNNAANASATAVNHVTVDCGVPAVEQSTTAIAAADASATVVPDAAPTPNAGGENTVVNASPETQLNVTSLTNNNVALAKAS